MSGESPVAAIDGTNVGVRDCAVGTSLPFPTMFTIVGEGELEGLELGAADGGVTRTSGEAKNLVGEDVGAASDVVWFSELLTGA